MADPPLDSGYPPSPARTNDVTDPPSAARPARGPYRRPVRPARRAAFVVSAVLFTVVWLLPLGLGYLAVTNPEQAYKTSPAEARNPWDGLSSSDHANLRVLGLAIGFVMALLVIFGVWLAWYGAAFGRPWPVAISGILSGAFLVVGAWLAPQGYWALWPVVPFASAWILGALATVIGFFLRPIPEYPRRPAGQRPVT
ncbi:MAG: hypothetical protein ACYDDF_04545 [Thermoplasmatota archaeon]